MLGSREGEHSEQQLELHRQYVGEQRHYRRGVAWFTVPKNVPVHHSEVGEITKVTDLTGRPLYTILEGSPRLAPQGSFDLLIHLEEGGDTAFTFAHPEDITEVLNSSGVKQPQLLFGRRVKLFFEGAVSTSGIKIFP